MASIRQFRGGGAKQDFSKEVLAACDGSPLLARLLANRGIVTPEAIRAFLDMGSYQPSIGWDLPDMRPAVDRILKAIEAQEPILVYGDFDVDGITGTSILYETLKKHLNANVSYYIPDRATEGHGMNTAALVRLTSSRRVKLVITTDTGITNFSEVSLLNGLGVDTVITDHHALPENLPPAVANVNSQRLLKAHAPAGVSQSVWRGATGQSAIPAEDAMMSEFAAPTSVQADAEHPMSWLCGAGVAYKLCELLLEASLTPEQAATIAESLLDIVAVGTVVDMVPLVGENRYLVWRGLQVLNRRGRLGFNELLAQAGFKPDGAITSETLGFTIGPRLNALGRLERADQGVELITTDDPERARKIAMHLEHLNRRRRDLCDQTFLEAESHLRKLYGPSGLGDERAVILASPDWNPGIIGIAASRLIERYHVPVFMMVVDESQGVVRCSGRSIPGFHLHDELQALSNYFLNFGGHAGAGGFGLKLDRLEAFKRDLHALCAEKITESQMRPTVTVDATLEWPQINPHLVDLIRKLAPFGMSNPAPKFVVENVQIVSKRFMGEGDRHVKLVLSPVEALKSTESKPLEGIIWNFDRNGQRFESNTSYSFVVVPELNTFNGVTKVQLLIEDVQEVESARRHTTTTTESGLSTASGNGNRIALSQAASPAMVSSVVAPAADLSQSDSQESAEETPQWIDHRSREAVESFIGQLMLPLQDKRRVLIYHEGRKPEIPFLDETLLAGRLEARAADELILWDLPPSASIFRQLLDGVQPEVIHLVGGKYRNVPVFPEERNYLKLLVQALKREGGELIIELATLAARLAVTPAVVTHGLILLEKLSILEACPTSSEDVSADTPVHIRLRPPSPTSEQTDRHLEVLPFRQALAEVGKFRGWLLKSQLATIKSVVNSPLLPLLSEPAITPSAEPEPGSRKQSALAST